MEAVQNWTREYFVSNQEECFKRLSTLSQEERACLRSNLNFKENGSLVLINHFFVTDIKEPEFYCEKYELKKADGSARVEHGKFCERIEIAEDETCEDPEKYLGERQTCIITESPSNNQWVKEQEATSIASNKRKLEVDTSQKNYLVRIYDSSEVLLNQLVEVIGFVYASSSNNSMETDDFGDTIDQPPPYVIHAIVFKEQPHNNPLLLQENEQQDDVYNEIHRILTQFMFNDEIAAQYVLCHLISSLYARVNDESLGKFTLNLICHSIPLEVLNEYTQNLYSFFECLLPNSLYIPLSIENLNTSSFVPKKDYTKNRLSSGVLQLPNNTHLVLDETKMANGKLDQAGVMAISDLSELIQTQKLSYDFQFYKIPYNTDYPVLIISEGKSLLPVSIHSITFYIIFILTYFNSATLHCPSWPSMPIQFD